MKFSALLPATIPLLVLPVVSASCGATVGWNNVRYRRGPCPRDNECEPVGQYHDGQHIEVVCKTPEIGRPEYVFCPALSLFFFFFFTWLVNMCLLLL